MKKVPEDVSQYMAKIGSIGGQATGATKRRGNSEYYRNLVAKRRLKREKKP